MSVKSQTVRLKSRFFAPSRAGRWHVQSARRVIASSCIALLGLTAANSAPAREVDYYFNAGILATAGVEIASLDLVTVLQGLSRVPTSEQVQVASLSTEWDALTKRIDRLPRSLVQSLKRLDEGRWWSNAKPRATISTVKTPDQHRPAKIQLQPAEIALERVAIPQPRPLDIPHDEKVDTAIASPALQPKPKDWSGHMLFLGQATACFLLMAGYLAHRYRVASLRSKNDNRSDKLIDNAIESLSKDAQWFAPSLGSVLDRIQERYGLSAASITVFDRETLSIQSTYSSQSSPTTGNWLVEEAMAELYNQGMPFQDQTLWRYPESIDELAKPEPDAVTSIAWNDARTGVMFTAFCEQGRCSLALDAKVLQVHIRRLAKIIDGVRDRAPDVSSRDSSCMSLDSKDQLAGTIAHEFNNLLMPIMGYAEMAADALNPGSHPRAYIERIQSAGERAKRVVEQVLALSRNQEHCCGSFDVLAATAEIVPDLRMCVPAAADFRVHLPDGPMHLYGDSLAFQQAVLNLCKNAGEAVANGGRVMVRVAGLKQSTFRSMTQGHLYPGRYVRVSVSDTGTGIAAEDLPRIFDPFFTTRSEAGGTGLGLPTVLRAVTLADGCINVRSSPSSGTRFDLFFPCSNLSGYEKRDNAVLGNHGGWQNRHRQIV